MTDVIQFPPQSRTEAQLPPDFVEIDLDDIFGLDSLGRPCVDLGKLRAVGTALYQNRARLGLRCFRAQMESGAFAGRFMRPLATDLHEMAQALDSAFDCIHHLEVRLRALEAKQGEGE